MIDLPLLYLIVGLLFAVVALYAIQDRRFAAALFWGSYSLIFLAGDHLPKALVGALVVLMSTIGGLSLVKARRYQELSSEQQLASVQRLGHKLFVPALLIPLGTVFGVLVLAHLSLFDRPLLSPANLTLSALAVAAFIALLFALYYCREKPQQALAESSRLIEAMGWAVLLPQLLATLGLLFTQAGVGDTVAELSQRYLALEHPLAAVACYALGMALFTVIMGNAFAAFPVITAGIGIPLLVQQHGINPAMMAAIGMFSGYCGTLLTPMAANFNIVPVALLELNDKHAVIKAQAPTAVWLLLTNIVLMYLFLRWF
ncbi:DUF979 domain-containing protein [Rheinheimera sp.]|uniref:DUF979 domain-containing protein n=1 Tax=Rheinheimera sp. TaxID=1869214 RepID=UPI00307F1D01